MRGGGGYTFVMKELPNGALVKDAAYDQELNKYNQQIKENERLADIQERKKRLELEQAFQKERAEHEMTNKYFITLATLSAASITLLVQYISDALNQYGNLGKFAIKTSLALFGVSLILCIAHNYVNTNREILNTKKDKTLLVIVSLAAVVSYILGIGILVIAVISSF